MIFCSLLFILYNAFGMHLASRRRQQENHPIQLVMKQLPFDFQLAAFYFFLGCFSSAF